MNATQLEDYKIIRVADWAKTFIADNTASTRVMGHGGRGGGKSDALLWKLITRANHKGATEGLYRDRLIDLERTTFKLLMEGTTTRDAILPVGTYAINRKLREIRLIPSGGKIVYNGFDQGDMSRQMGGVGGQSSLNLTGAAIDEWTEVSEANNTQLGGAVRIRHPAGFTPQIYGVTNPSSPSSYLARIFGLGDEPAMPRHHAVFAPVDDNLKNLDPSFIVWLNSLTGVAFQRYRQGKWVGSDSMTYEDFNRQQHVIDRDESESVAHIVGVDDGFTNPFVAMRAWYDGDRRVHVAAQHHGTKMQRKAKIDAIKAMGGMEAEAVVIDSASAELIAACQQAGLPAIPCQKGKDSIKYGCSLVRERLRDAGDGRPRLTVSPSCSDLIRELESYEWDYDRDEPIKANDHGPDGLRYLIRYLDANTTPMYEVVGSDTSEADARKAETANDMFDRLRADDPEWGWQ